jgi:cobalamin-dependent methionine synthase I
MKGDLLLTVKKIKRNPSTAVAFGLTADKLPPKINKNERNRFQQRSHIYKECAMYIIGAVINTSVDGITDMIEKRDKAELLRLAEMQITLGADMLAINCGDRVNSEPEDITWMIETIQQEHEIALCIDSPNPAAHQAGLEVHRYGRAMVDSITAEAERMEAILPLVKKHNAMVTAILHDESGMPSDVEGRLKVIPKIEAAIAKYGIDPEDVYLDCMVFPLSVDSAHASIYLDTLKAVKQRYPRYKTICGLNNISYGLPEEDVLVTAFVSMCAALGQEATYIEISKASGAVLKGVKALLNRDDYCSDYLGSYRAGMLDIFKK